jgi:hypothetical protein
VTVIWMVDLDGCGEVDGLMVGEVPAGLIDGWGFDCGGFDRDQEVHLDGDLSSRDSLTVIWKAIWMEVVRLVGSWLESCQVD